MSTHFTGKTLVKLKTLLALLKSPVLLRSRVLKSDNERTRNLIHLIYPSAQVVGDLAT
jgi:hypothetical protein